MKNINNHPLKFLLFLILFCISSCNEKNTSYKLDSNITKHFNDSFDIKNAIGKDFVNVNCRIRNGNALIMGLDSLNISYLFIINLSTKKIIFKTQNFVDKYYSTLWDFVDNEIIAISAHNSFLIYKMNIKTKKVNYENVSNKNIGFYTDILSNKNQLFYLNGTCGYSIVNLKSKKTSISNSFFGANSSDKTWTVSYPINNQLNLISDRINNSEIEFNAIDSVNEIHWKYKINNKYVDTKINLLNWENNFIVGYDSFIICINKKNGEVVWRKKMMNKIQEILINNRISDNTCKFK